MGKMLFFSKLKILWHTIMGYGYKYMVDLGVLKIPYLNNHNCDIVVSLTSYGRRVADCVVYYTLYGKRSNRAELLCG